MYYLGKRKEDRDSEYSSNKRLEKRRTQQIKLKGNNQWGRNKILNPSERKNGESLRKEKLTVSNTANSALIGHVQ